VLLRPSAYRSVERPSHPLGAGATDYALFGGGSTDSIRQSAFGCALERLKAFLSLLILQFVHGFCFYSVERSFELRSETIASSSLLQSRLYRPVSLVGWTVGLLSGLLTDWIASLVELVD